jgi:RNA recognition motif-containing protein
MTTEDARKLFVAGLPDSITEEVLRQLFHATGGTVLEVSLPKDRTSGRTRGFGFVTLETVEQAERSRAALDGSVQAGRPISVRPFQGGTARREVRVESPAISSPVSSPAEDRTLYVGNLPYDATAEEVEEVLSRCGVTPVLRVHLPIGPDGRPRGFGFVTLSSADAVQQSLSDLANADLRGRRVMVKVAHPRGAAQPSAAARPGAGPTRPALRSTQSDGSSTTRFEAPRGDEIIDAGPHRPPQPSGEFEEDEEGARVAAGKRTDKKRKGVAAAAKRKGGAAEESRRRGGAASWQRWKDWDED